jgi:zinc protease
MINYSKRIIVCALGLSASIGLLSCSSRDLKSQSAVDNTEFRLRDFSEITLNNGLRVIFIQDTSLPRVSLQLLISAGSINDPDGKKGITALTMSLLDQGTAKRTANQISDELNQIGSEIAQVPGQDFSTVSVSALSTHKEKVLGIFSDIVMNPAFSAKEINRVRSELRAALMRIVDQPSSFADQKLEEVLFGNHPYGKPILGEVVDLEKISRTDLIRHYFRYVRPNNSSLAVVGNFNEDFKEKVKSLMATWQMRPLENNQLASIIAQPRKEIFLFAKKDLKQTQIRIGQIGITRNHPDFLKLRLANLVLGGAFASRLNQKIRDDLGLTYSISSQSDPRLVAGTFEVSTFTRHEKTKTVIAETLKLVDDFVGKGISQRELNAAKNLLIAQFPGAIETPDRLGYNLLVLRRYGIPDSYLKEFITNVQAVTLAEVNAAIKNNLNAKNLQIVVFSDKEQVLPQLSEIETVQVREL